MATKAKAVKSVALVKTPAKTVTYKTTKKATVGFPWTDVPLGKSIDITKIRNSLDKKRLKTAKPKTLKQSVEELEKNPLIAAQLAELVKSGKKFDPAKIGEGKKLKIGRTTFLEETQRLVIPKHVADIMEHCQEELLSPVFVTKSADGKTNPSFDTQHGINVVALFAKYDLWLGCDAAKWEDFEFPFFIIDNTDTAFANEAAYHRNGKGQKKWTSFDFHRIKIAGVRQHNSTDKTYVDAEPRQF